MNFSYKECKFELQGATTVQLDCSYSPVPRLSFATRFDTKLREKSFEKQYSAKAVLFTMYVPTVGICTQICARTWVIMKFPTRAPRLKLLSRSFGSKQKYFSVRRNIFEFHFRSQKCEHIWLQN